MIRKILAFAVLSLIVMFPALASAQSGSITGTITDSRTGEALPGATVFLPDLSLGQSTNLDGQYTISNVPAGTHAVRITYVGYVAQLTEVTVTAGEQTTLNIEMVADRVELRDLVVTGYGVQPRREVTGSIAQVRGESIANIPVQTFDSAIQGRAAGVTITSASGQPGGAVRVRVRGTGSIGAGNDPLYVVDGVPVTVNTDVSTQASSNALAAIAPSDIESIEILKDAAAASIYGAQAANGVVLITTKRGAAGRTNFTVNSQVGISEPTNTYDMLNGQEWVAAQIEGRRNQANAFARRGQLGNAADPDVQERNFRGQGTPTGTAAQLIGLPDDPAERAIIFDPTQTSLEEFLQYVPSYDWQDEVYHTGNSRSFGISAQGGSDQTRFFISGSYEYQEAQVIRSNFERFNVRSNIDHTVSELFTLETSIGLTTFNQFGAIADGNFINGPFFAAPYSVPIQAIYNEDGSFNENVTGNYNIIQGLRLEEREARTNQVVGNIAGNFNLTPNLVFRSFYGIDYRNVRDTNVRPPEIPAFSGQGGSTFEANREILNYNTNQTLSYFNTFDDVHNLSSLVGFEYRHQTRESFTASGTGFNSGLFRYLQNAATPASVGGFFTEYKIAGFFGQARYDFDKRYFATATLRYDGSSRFGADKQWGLFYAGSLGWELSEENFLADVEWLDQLQLRASYGVTGNSQIGDFGSRSLFGGGATYNGVAALRAIQLGNNVLTWEEAATINLGLNWALFEGRIYGAVDVYRRTNSRLLLPDFLFADSGFGSFNNNIGEVRNQGIEVEIGGTLVNWEGLRWVTDFNITFQENEVRDLGQDEGEEFRVVFGRRLDIGRPIFQERLIRFAGVNPADGRGMFYDRDGNITYTPTADDVQYVGSAFPDVIGGWNNTVSYSGFTLDIFFQYSLGQDSFKQQEGFFLDGTVFRGRGLTARTLDRWQRPGDLTDMPRLLGGAQTEAPGIESDFFFTASTWHLEDVGYVRLKSASLSYAIPNNLVSQIGLASARVFVQGVNLITWTNYRGLDPEIIEVANAPFPQARQYSAGVSLQF